MNLSDSAAFQARKYELVDPDVRLMLLVQNDNAAAFEELVSRYQDRLIQIFDHVVPNRAMGEELAQEVFLRVYRARKTYSPDAKFSTWLFTIANNVASNAIRSLSKRKEIQLGHAAPNGSGIVTLEHLAPAASGFMPARRLDRKELTETVRRAIQSLNERQRMAMLLSRFEGMSYEDIGKTMGLSVQAVKSLTSRAREKLREILEPYIAEGRDIGVEESDDTPEEFEG
ncbi:MAG: sigma-70 family RNA polymerase sigma factor [Pirellulaceae bacterium]